LKKIPFDVALGSRNAIVTIAVCNLIANTLTEKDIEPETSSVPQWKRMVEAGLKHRDPEVQRAASTAIRALSKLTDCSVEVKR
jgi:tubulin-specific chaperone D